jgi:cytochrome c2
VSSETPNSGHKPPIPKPAKRIPAFNIDKRGDRLYEVTHLHKWFAISSLLLFLFTVGMVLDDYSREWKRYQRTFNRLSIERTQQEMQQAASTIDRAKFDQLQQQLQQAQAGQQQNETDIERIQGQIDDLQADFFASNQNYQFEKAIYDAEKYGYEEAVARKASNVGGLGERLKETERQMNDYKGEVDRLSIEIRKANDELNKFVGQRNTIQRDMDAMLQDYQRLQTRMNALDPGLVVTSFRNAPVFDMLAPSERINQILLPNLYYDHPFKLISRVDRCTTCHLGIDQQAFQDAPQPFKTHPQMDLYLAASSPHPMEQFGCTTCHSGLDRAVDFQTAGHMPRDAAQRQEWEEKYGWHEEHFLETPMFAMNNIEAGCYKCHNASAEVPRAASLNNGRDLIRIYGCFGCHRIPGYESVRKVGPDLSTVSGKLTRDWVKKWLSNPKAFKSEARMPQFWGNSNNSGTENATPSGWDKRNATEISAIAEYLFSKSKPRNLPAGRNGGSAERGKQIVESVGCFGCHAIGPIQEAAGQSQTRRKHGYNLAGQGSKVTATWIYNWVKDPQQVWAGTKMPSLRLTDAEAADVTAYLTSLKNPEFEAQAAPETDAAALDEITIELLRTGSTDIEARETLQTMSLEQKNLFAGERLISRYGCFGCHTIPGFENAQPIGTELTEAGSKLISQLDFGFLNIEHSRRGWYEQKLKDPRIFDVGRVKRPEELSKMPNFRFSETEVSSIAMVLTSLVKDPVPLEMRDRTPAAISEGRLLIAEKNCKGCHLLEGAGGDIRPTMSDQAMWPPNLATQGAKTQPMWLHPFLKDPASIRLRPWLTARMPTFHFTEQESATIGRYMSALDNVDYPFISTDIATSNEKLQAGAQLFTTLQCAKCHPTSTGPPPPGVSAGDLAPNLTIAHERLRPEWVLNWLVDPQKIMIGTRMPTFFPDGPDKPSPLVDVLGGNVRTQIEAIRDHIFITLSGGRRRPSPVSTTND